MIVGRPNQHNYNGSIVYYRTTDENWNSPSVLSKTAQSQREERVGGTEADHNKTNTMDSERTSDECLCNISVIKALRNRLLYIA